MAGRLKETMGQAGTSKPASRPISLPSGEKARIASIDVLRGLVMALMALDHTRDFFSAGGFNPRDVGETALFLTRWITHFCAPTFVLLAGLSAFLYGRGRTVAETSRFLFIRGLWLILIEFTIVRFGWTFDLSSHEFTAGVIWAIGASMVALAILIWLPLWAIAGVAMVMIASHNLLDGIRAEQLGAGGAVWHILHQPGAVHLGEGISVSVLYPLIPWIGVMALGYALGPVMQLEPGRRQHFLLVLGAALTLGFIALRAINLYGDPAPWSMQATWPATVLSFVDCEKYPPSLLYLLMTLGPALMLLAWFDHARGQLADVLATFGQVPFFYYVVHIYLIHLLAVAVGFAMTGVLVSNPAIGLGLLEIYVIWLLMLVLLYPVCRWFARVKQQGTGWWWSYL
jgi:uncharacterized membrane protein